jgi:hypothetical protein
LEERPSRQINKHEPMPEKHKEMNER